MVLNSELVWAIIGGASSVAAFLWGIFVFVIPYYEKVRDSRKNEEKNNLGPYTNNIIEDAAKYYVRPKGSKSDPTHTFGKAKTEIHELDLFDEVENFIEDEEYKKFL